jgi:hypothetical protein
MHLGAEAKVTVGTSDTLLESTAAAGERSVIFEDDGTTGYFYAIRPGAELEILDALHVYDVASIADRQIPVTVQIFWAENRAAAVLLINGHSHALYDFERSVGFCRNAFPAARNQQLLKRKLTDELVEQYFSS